MPIFEYLERNAKQYPDDIALVEINPNYEPASRITWRDYALMEPQPGEPFRREITWKTFDDKANMFANLLFTRGVAKGDKVAVLLMNSIEWLPIYFGILKTGAVAVPLNYRYTAEEIKYCLDKSDSSMLIFGPEFTGRIEEIVDRIPKVRQLFYVGEDCPSFADSFEKMIKFCSHKKPEVTVSDEDDGAIYFSSGTTGFPKATATTAAIATEPRTPIRIGIIFAMPLPQMLHTTITTRATRAMGQLVAQLLMAEGARIRPMAMMMGPVTTGGKNFITFLLPQALQMAARIRYSTPAQATPAQA